MIFPPGALHTVLNDGFRKGDNIFLKLINRNFISIIHCFRNNVILLLTGTDVMVLYPLGGRCTQFLMTNSEKAIPARGRRVQFSMTDFERAIMVSH